MKATLIFPGIAMKGWNCFGNAIDPEANFIPYGLAYISSYAKSKGHIIDALDLRRMKGWDEFKDEISKRSPGVFGVSSMSVDFGVAIEAIKIIKDIDKGSIIVLGGVHATVALEDSSQIIEIDHIVTGEGEIAFTDALERLERKESLPRVIEGTTPNINTLPYPDREIFNFRDGEMKTPWLAHMPLPFISMITTRGCPFKCTFCQPAERMVFGGKARFRDVDNVIAELMLLRNKYNFKSLLIHDDLFTFNKKWVLEFCKKYKKNGFNQIFTCQARADFIAQNEDAVREMKESGLSCFMIGFESGSQRILDFIQKGTTIEQNRKAVEICHKYGIKIFANYMFGIPAETKEEVFTTIDFIRWARPEHPSPAFFTPYPGSYLYDYCKEKDISLIDSYQNYARNPTQAKIRGIDYEFLSFAVERSKDYKIDEELDRLGRNRFLHIFLKGYKSALKDKKMKLSNLDRYYRESNNMVVSCEKRPETEKRILVTGGTGFIGSALVRGLIDKGYPVTVLTRNSKSHIAKTLEGKGVEVIQGCVEGREIIPKLTGFPVVFHLAASLEPSDKNMFEINVKGTQNLLNAAKEGKTQMFIYASSIEAQGPGRIKDIPLTEDAACRPVSDYGRSKLEAEKNVIEYINTSGLNAVIARIGNVYGVGSSSFVYYILESILSKNPLLMYLSLFKDRFIQPIYISDLINSFLMIIESKNSINGIYNITGGNPIKIGKWFQIVGSFFKKNNIVEQYINRPLSKDLDIASIKRLHPYINYYLSGDEPYIHRSYSDNKLKKAIGDYEHFNILKGSAYTLEWLEER